MATTTEDPTEQLTSTVYGLFHGEDLVYVGETTQTLQRRRNLHFVATRQERDLPIYDYLADIDDLRAEVEIRELEGYDSEAEALKAHDTLNEDERGRGGQDKPDWIPSEAELEVIEEKTLREAADKLDRGYEEVRNIAKRLDLLESSPSGHLSDSQVQAIWVRYKAFPGESYADVAERFDTNPTTVGGIIRREIYDHVEVPSEAAIEAKKAYQNGVVREEPAVGTKRVGAR